MDKPLIKKYLTSLFQDSSRTPHVTWMQHPNPVYVLYCQQSSEPIPESLSSPVPRQARMNRKCGNG